MNGSELECVQVFRYLGIHLDECLMFDKHVDCSHRKVTQCVGVLCRARTFLDKYMTLLWYKNLVLLYFDYGNIIYMVTSKI